MAADELDLLAGHDAVFLPGVRADLQPEHGPQVCTVLRSEDGRGSAPGPPSSASRCWRRWAWPGWSRCFAEAPRAQQGRSG